MSDLRLNNIEERARAIANRRRGCPALPIVVEFAGSPKAGKSTTIDILTHFFKRMGFRVWAPTEGASKRTPYHLKRDLVAFNTWTLNYAISELLISYHNVEPQDLIILDRGPFDSLAWMGIFHKQGDLSSKDFNVIRDFALHDRWTKLIDRLYLFTCSPATSLAREMESKLTSTPGSAMNKQMLQTLLTRYKELEKELDGYPVRSVSTDDPSSKPQATAFELASDLLHLFEAK